MTVCMTVSVHDGQAREGAGSTRFTAKLKGIGMLADAKT
jgi:hypothetical protein